MPNLRTGRKCSHHTHMVMNRFVDWCHLCGSIRVKTYRQVARKSKFVQVFKSEWISPPAKKREAVAYLLERTSS